VAHINQRGVIQAMPHSIRVGGGGVHSIATQQCMSVAASTTYYATPSAFDPLHVSCAPCHCCLTHLFLPLPLLLLPLLLLLQACAQGRVCPQACVPGGLCHGAAARHLGAARQPLHPHQQHEHGAQGVGCVCGRGGEGGSGSGVKRGGVGVGAGVKMGGGGCQGAAAST
jgi:hypothetical protein